MTSKNLTMVSNRLQERKKAELTNAISGISSELAEPNIIIPEIVFKEYFLDFFKNGGIGQTDSPLLLKWLELAGGPYNEVSVVDEKGETLFVVPSIYVKPEIKTEKIDKINMDNLIGTFNNKLNRFVADGLNYLDENLTYIEKQILVSKQEHLKRWNEIFARYDKPQTSQPKQIKQNNKINQNDADIFDYD